MAVSYQPTGILVKSQGGQRLIGFTKAGRSLKKRAARIVSTQRYIVVIRQALSQKQARKKNQQQAIVNQQKS
ncbi:hypothetical protein ACFQ48_09720 [Hymenobacter caeli]|uniref:50S ribosomal protein L34 n=1 Tax=Hymenobacter caeli TaxID=2735894 RepID=A0ABX2FPL7_9BACT|nr:hypothetical protein [Hymenobacter caeli]NRT18350.1 hypothetical protein [Hymenobacter caeli]